MKSNIRDQITDQRKHTTKTTISNNLLKIYPIRTRPLNHSDLTQSTHLGRPRHRYIHSRPTVLNHKDPHSRTSTEKMDDLEEQLTYHEAEDDLDDLVIDDHGSNVESGLSNADYNLDSPLNSDFIDGLVTYLKTKIEPLHHKSRILREATVIVEHQQIRVENLRDHHSFHHILGDILIQASTRRSVSLTGIKNHMEETLEGKLRGEEYLTNFKTRLGLPHRTNAGFRDEEASKLNYEAGYLTLYIQTHALVLILNGTKDLASISDQSKKSHWEDFGIKFKNNLGFAELELTELGTVVLFGETLFLKHWNLLIDKNMLLMIKDIAVGRFMTLNINSGNESNLSETLTTLFNLGDSLLRDEGNIAYDAIKILEPTCVHRWMQISERSKYDKLSADKFMDHLKRTKTKLIVRSQQFFDRLVDLIQCLTNPKEIGTVFGSFRLWGHPIIDYKEGLKALRTQCRIPKEIDESYARQLADDFSYLVIKDHYRKTGQWAIEETGAPRVLRQFIREGRWPPAKLIRTSNISWSQLNKNFFFYDVPSDIPLSQLYSDKSFSMTRSELRTHLYKDNATSNPIPSRRVLEELLKRPTINPREFAEKINNHGLPDDDLIIGLKEKERELKRIGRFFTLMSWNLREYIVLTEYLIKKFYLPLFDGVTMSDGLSTIFKKMIQVTSGQSSDENRSTITYANHIDYEKWNNHQRGPAVNPVFTEMGKFFGLPNLFSRTHEFFEKSLIYYTGRPDLIKWVPDRTTLRVNELFT